MGDEVGEGGALAEGGGGLIEGDEIGHVPGGRGLVVDPGIEEGGGGGSDGDVEGVKGAGEAKAKGFDEGLLPGPHAKKTGGEIGAGFEVALFAGGKEAGGDVAGGAGAMGLDVDADVGGVEGDGKEGKIAGVGEVEVKGGIDEVRFAMGAGGEVEGGGRAPEAGGKGGAKKGEAEDLESAPGRMDQAVSALDFFRGENGAGAVEVGFGGEEAGPPKVGVAGPQLGERGGGSPGCGTEDHALSRRTILGSMMCISPWARESIRVMMAWTFSASP